MGQTEFDAWIDRLMSGISPKLTATRESLAFAWAEMIMHLGPTEDHKPDIHFIKAAHKAAANQIAWANMDRLRAEAKARLAAAEEKQKEEADKAFELAFAREKKRVKEEEKKARASKKAESK